jgi:hypothetical protein
MEIAAKDPPIVHRGDAADWVEERLTVDATPGLTRVLMHLISDRDLQTDADRGS